MELFEEEGRREGGVGEGDEGEEKEDGSTHVYRDASECHHCLVLHDLPLAGSHEANRTSEWSDRSRCDPSTKRSRNPEFTSRSDHRTLWRLHEIDCFSHSGRNNNVHLREALFTLILISLYLVSNRLRVSFS